MFPSFRPLATAFLAAFLLVGAAVSSASAQDKTLATVNGQAVTEADLHALFQQLPPQIQQQGYAAIQPLLLEEVIGRKVMVMQARAKGFENDPEVKERLAQIENELIYNLYVIKEAEKRVDDAAVKAAYDAWAAKQPTGEEVRASHILVETEDEAKEIIKEVTAGKPFADLAKEKSKDPGSAAKGGDLGYLRKGDTVAPFENAAFALQPNTFTSTPVKSQFGWHVILVTDRRAIKPPSYEEMAPQFRQQLAEAQVRGIIEEAIGQAQVQRFDENGNPIAAPAQ